MKRIILFSTVVASLLLILFIGNSMTGLVVFDDNTKELCETNNDCAKPNEVCCLFDGETAGVCSAESRCPAISGITKSKELNLERPARIYSPGMIIIAGTIFILAIALALAIMFYKIKHKVHDKIHKYKEHKASKTKSSRTALKEVSFYSRIFPVKVKIEKESTGKYIVLIVVIVALVAILFMIC